MKTTDAKSPAKASSQRPKIGFGEIPRFQIPPSVLIFRELRRMEQRERQLPSSYLTHLD
jgi:hypothetical protein